MSDTIEPEGRTAAMPTDHNGPVTLINLFVVDPERDEEFLARWHDVSAYMRTRAGFRELRFHRAVSPDAHHRYANVAVWDSMEAFAAAHAAPEFHELVSRPGWEAFPSTPTLYEVVVEYAAPQAAAA